MTVSYDDSCVNPERDIIIYGASVYGEITYRGLELLNLKPRFFCDRARAGQVYYNTQVISPGELINYKNADILIASADFFNEMKRYLEDIGCKNYYDIDYLLNLSIPQDKLSNRAREMYDNRKNYRRSISGGANDLTIVHLGFCVSERCTLKCRDCSFLMQYYQHPHNIDLDKYKYALDRFFDIIDGVSEFRIYGGEPFINRSTYKLIEWYSDNDKIGIISIYTNGTVIPDQKTLEALKDRKVKVHISDYKHNREQIDKLVQILRLEGIPYFIRKYDMWQQAGSLEDRGYSEKKLTEIYESCFATNCYSFLKGRLHTCPRSAHAMNLGAIEDTAGDYVDFCDVTKSNEELRSKLKNLMINKKYLNACRSCDSLDNHIGGIEPAIQTKKALEYRKVE